MVYLTPSYVDLYANGNTKTFFYAFKRNSLKFSAATLRTGDSLKTPYGYGGYNINTKNKKFIQDAFKSYYEYCKDQGIKKETILQHPLIDIQNKDYYSLIEHNRDVVVVDLAIHKELRFKQYSQTARNILRKNQDIIVSHSDKIKTFIELYYLTMQRNQASDKYYFNEQYFRDLLRIPNVELLKVVYDKKIIAMGTFFLKPPYASYHLSANAEISYELNANYHLLHQAFDIAKERGCTHMLLGGGKGVSPTDPLLAFKKKFSKMTKPFYILEKHIL